MAYCAIPPETDIGPVLEKALLPGKCLLLPRCEKNGGMTARVIRDLSCLRQGAYGIPEPTEDMPVFPVEDIDLILVPGLAFDAAGRRLGRGKGYYDRFLQGFGGKTVGVCRCLLPQVPVEPHDVIMDAVVTADGIFYGMEDDACLRKS